MGEFCPNLQQRLTAKLVDDPASVKVPQSIEDFEVTYSINSSAEKLELELTYAFLGGVLRLGSQKLLEQVWDGMPFQCSLELEQNIMRIEVDTANLTSDVESRQRMVSLLASTRNWLLIGPLMKCLAWLRDSAPRGVAKPQPFAFQVRQFEICWIVPKEDRIMVIFGVHLDAEADVVLGRSFCVEFADAHRRLGGFSPPCNFFESKEPPTDIRQVSSQECSVPPNFPNVGYLCITLSDQAVAGASDERLMAIARPVMTFRHFFLFHLISARSYLHSWLRTKLDGWQQKWATTRRETRRAPDKRRTIKGKEFTPSTHFN